MKFTGYYEAIVLVLQSNTNLCNFVLWIWTYVKWGKLVPIFGQFIGRYSAELSAEYSAGFGRIFGIGRYQFFLYRSYTIFFHYLSVLLPTLGVGLGESSIKGIDKSSPKPALVGSPFWYGLGLGLGFGPLQKKVGKNNVRIWFYKYFSQNPTFNQISGEFDLN